MSGIKLLEKPFLELLPRALQHDPKIIALAQGIDKALAKAKGQIDNVRIWSRLDELEEPLLSNLAFQMHIEGYEGWHLAETLTQKRQMLREAYKMHFYKGTRYSLERFFEILEMPGRVTEWWEAGADPELRPYEFDMDIDVNRKVPRTFYYDTWQLIHALKNERSHLRRGLIRFKTHGQMVVHAYTTAGATAEVTPLVPKRIVTKGALFVRATTTAGATETVQPLTPSRMTTTGEMYVSATMAAGATVTVAPATPKKIKTRATVSVITATTTVGARVTVWPLRTDESGG